MPHPSMRKMPHSNMRKFLRQLPSKELQTLSEKSYSRVVTNEFTDDFTGTKVSVLLHVFLLCMKRNGIELPNFFVRFLLVELLTTTKKWNARELNCGTTPHIRSVYHSNGSYPFIFCGDKHHRTLKEYYACSMCGYQARLIRGVPCLYNGWVEEYVYNEKEFEEDVHADVFEN